MRTLRTVAELRAALAGARLAGQEIGLVPTMGAFHEGHLALIRRARRDCDQVVVSLFVNPTQFNDARDLARYPRDERRDAALAAELGVDHLFAPEAGELYPPGFATTVSVRGLTDVLEGAQRGRGHFDGVTTVVTKLLNIVRPDVAYFGQKDAQQVAVVRRLVADLQIPVRIEVCPTVRAADGLALSSRNALLSDDDRGRAAALNRALRAVASAVAGGERVPGAAIATGARVLERAGIEPEYLELADPATLAPLSVLGGQALALIAAQVGPVRLIDNIVIEAARDGTAALPATGAVAPAEDPRQQPVATPAGAPTQ